MTIIILSVCTAAVTIAAGAVIGEAVVITVRKLARLWRKVPS